MAKLTRSILVLALMLGAALALGACGEEKTMERPVDPRLAYAPAAGGATTTATPDDLMVIRLKNVKWDLVAPYYKKFLAQKHASPKDAFAPQVLKFVPRPVIAEKEEATAEDIQPVEEEPRTPLQQYKLKDYKLLLIMSGTAVPKAVVVDPKRQAYVIQRDTRIGNKGGIVESITQYMVVVKEPNEEEPTKMTIKPPFIDLVSETGLEGFDTVGEDEFAVPPSMDIPVMPLPEGSP